MAASNPYYALLARLQRVTNTDNGDIVEDLTVEPGPADPPRLIRGVILERGANGMRQVPCSWLPSGRHRLYEKLNITIPELPANPLT